MNPLDLAELLDQRAKEIEKAQANYDEDRGAVRGSVVRGMAIIYSELARMIRESEAKETKTTQ